MQGPDPADVGAALERVYARSEFVVRETPWLARLLSDAWSAVRRWFWQQLSGLGLGELAPWLPWVVLLLLAGVAVWALTHFIAARPHRATWASTEAVLRVALPDDAAAWEAAARAALEQGRYRDAAHALFHATVLRLQETGVVQYHAGKTPGEYRREVRGAAVARQFDGFVMRFLPLAFGAAEPDAAAVEALWRTGRELGVRA